MNRQNAFFLMFNFLIIAVILALAPCAAAVIYDYDSLNRLKKVDYGNGIIISYTYDAAGNRLTYTATAAQTRVISLSGNMVFGNAPIGSSQASILTISNTGNSPLAVTGITYPPGFSGAWSGNIPAGFAQPVTVTFTPTIVQTYSGNITVNSNKTAGDNSIAISGVGTPLAVSTLLSDNFNASTIDPSLWNVRNSVSQTGQIIRVSTDVTDQPGQLTSNLIPISSGKTITITRKVFLHRANSYFLGRFSINITGLPLFSVRYMDYAYSSSNEIPRHGIFISRNNTGPNYVSQQADTSTGIPAIWDNVVRRENCV